MTEAEWDKSWLPHELIDGTRPLHTWRKLLLLGCACSRFGVAHDRDPGGVIADALAYLERVADAGPWPTDWLERRTRVTDLYDGDGPRRKLLDAMYHAFGIAQRAEINSARALAELVMNHVGRPDHIRADHEAMRGFVLDILGHPFRPVAFDPRWRSADAVGLARGIYDERAFERMPLLADALMDAGCADEQVLAHCRSDGPHVRGCWVVDLVLGKE
jgi:hypothetical protein